MMMLSHVLDNDIMVGALYGALALGHMLVHHIPVSSSDWGDIFKSVERLLSPAYEIGRGILKWCCPSFRPSFRPSPAFSQ